MYYTVQFSFEYVYVCVFLPINLMLIISTYNCINIIKLDMKIVHTFSTILQKWDDIDCISLSKNRTSLKCEINI